MFKKAEGRVLNWSVAEEAVAARAFGLVVVRESDEHDDLRFDGMREQTYQQQRHISALDAVRRLGLAPMDGRSEIVIVEELEDGSVREETVLVQQLRRGRTRAVLFVYQGYWHLWSQSSAAKVSSEGTNEFTEILIEVIRKIRPLILFAANISRLVRSQQQATLLQAGLYGNVDKIKAGTVEFVLTGENAYVGIVLLTTLAMSAAMERDWIVQRMTTGRLGQWRRNEWLFGASVVPFGYVFDAKSKQLHVDEAARASVREMLVVLAGDAPPQEMQRQLARAGVTTWRRSRLYKRRVSIDALTNARGLIDRLYSWSAMWCEGEYLFRLANTFAGIESLNGVPVTRVDERDIGEFQMLLKVPLPEGGWAEPEVLDAFRLKAMQRHGALVSSGKSANRPLSESARQESSNPQLHGGLLSPWYLAAGDMAAREGRARARARRTISPLSGRRWRLGDYFYELRAMRGSRYHLFSWPAAKERSALKPSGRPAPLHDSELS